MLQIKIIEEIKTHFFINNFFSKILSFMGCEKNIVARDGLQMTIERTGIACYIPKATNTHTHTICNNYSFSTATMVARTLLNVTLYVHCLLFFKKLRSNIAINLLRFCIFVYLP